MENVDKRKDIKLECEWENRGKRLGARAPIAKPNFHSSLKIHDLMQIIQMSRVKTLYNTILINFHVVKFLSS